MSKAARRSKTMGNGHREHRSKKNRKPSYNHERLKRVKYKFTNDKEKRRLKRYLKHSVTHGKAKIVQYNKNYI